MAPLPGRSRLISVLLLALFASACAAASAQTGSPEPAIEPLPPAPARLDASEYFAPSRAGLAPPLDAGASLPDAQALVRHEDGPWIDSITELSPTQLEITGWTNRSRRVDIIVDGVKQASTPVDIFRPDVANIQELGNSLVGFQRTVTVPADYRQVCVATPGTEPASWGCNRDYLLPNNLIITYYGVPGSPILGIIGEGNATWALNRLTSQAAAFEGYGKKVLPAFELIATVAQNYPGADGDYSVAIPESVLWDYLEKIREVDGILILDLQPGRSEYMDQLPAYEALLREPDVHLALDPEWDMEPWQVPGQQIGSSTAASINESMDWLSDLVDEYDLPPKLVIVHQFTPHMITNRDDLAPDDNIQMLLQMDGWGSPALKIGNYDRLSVEAPWFNGFKVFYRYDVPNLYPASMMNLDPPPELISYQ